MSLVCHHQCLNKRFKMLFDIIYDVFVSLLFPHFIQISRFFNVYFTLLGMWEMKTKNQYQYKAVIIWTTKISLKMLVKVILELIIKNCINWRMKCDLCGIYKQNKVVMNLLYMNSEIREICFYWTVSHVLKKHFYIWCYLTFHDI